MKQLLPALLGLLPYASAHAQAWPRNPTTGQVAFRGVLPWPARAKTAAQRRALVRRWYLAKLTDETAAHLRAEVNGVVNPVPLTYSQLPQAAFLQQGSGLGAIALGYRVVLTPATGGLSYRLAGFTYTRQGGDGMANSGSTVAYALATHAHRGPLTLLRKRLAVALAGW